MEELYEQQLQQEKELVLLGRQDEKERQALQEKQQEIAAFAATKAELEEQIAKEIQKELAYQEQKLNRVRQIAEREAALRQ